MNISNNLLNKSNSFKLEPRFEKLLNFSYWLHASPIACLFYCVNLMFIATSVNILTFFQVVNMLIALTGALQTSFSSSWSGFLPIENWSICQITNDSPIFVEFWILEILWFSPLLLNVILADDLQDFLFNLKFVFCIFCAQYLLPNNFVVYFW